MGMREAEAALKAMNPRELQNATLLMDNEAGRPRGSQHQVSYDPFAFLFRGSKCCSHLPQPRSTLSQPLEFTSTLLLLNST
jgi:hypothetical protein